MLHKEINYKIMFITNANYLINNAITLTQQYMWSQFPWLTQDHANII